MRCDRLTLGTLSICVLSSFSCATLAKEDVKVEVGAPAPDFTLEDQDGREVTLSGLRERKNVLIAFYPKDFTGG